MIEDARRPGSGIGLGIGIDDGQDPSTRLASETIRLARLAASTHMILSARLTDARPGELSKLLATRRGQMR
jgi:hypothetical protein